MCCAIRTCMVPWLDGWCALVYGLWAILQDGRKKEEDGYESQSRAKAEGRSENLVMEYDGCREGGTFVVRKKGQIHAHFYS